MITDLFLLASGTVLGISLTLLLAPRTRRARPTAHDPFRRQNTDPLIPIQMKPFGRRSHR